MKKWIRGILIGLLAVLLILSALPYIFPVPPASEFIPVLPFPESRSEIIDGVYVHYRAWTPSGTAVKGKVLLVHGWGGSTFSWRNNVDPLVAAGYMVVAVDLPGFGYSDRKAGLDQSQKIRSSQLWTLLDRLDASNDAKTGRMSWILGGHSMGAGTVAVMAMDRPDRTKALVFADGALFGNNSPIVSALSHYPPAARGLIVYADSLLSNPKSIRSLLASAYGRDPTDEEFAGYAAPLKLPGTDQTVLDLVRTSKNEPVDGLINLDIPILAIWGKNDTWVPISQASKLQKMIPRVELDVIDGAAHCSMETGSAEFNDDLAVFLKTLKEG